MYEETDGLLEQAQEAAGSVSADLIKYAILALVAVIILLVLRRMFRRKKGVAPTLVPDLAVDIGALPTEGPSARPPVLEHYNVPVRLAVLVLAPTGRVRELPPIDRLPDFVDHILPGLADVLLVHKPLIRRWPPQLSSEGFARTFFAHVKLPGDRGKGTAWCSIAGRFKIGRETFMAGLLLRSDAKNNFSESIIREEHEWLGILRVKSGQ